MNKIKVAIFSLAFSLTLLFGGLSPVLASQITDGLCAGSNLQFTDNPSGANCSTTEATDKVNRMIQTVINLFSAIVGIIAVVMIIVGGLRYITSGGNDASVTSAKNTLLYAIIGLIIVALAQVIVRFTLSKLANT